jgi:hypothetical protein
MVVWLARQKVVEKVVYLVARKADKSALKLVDMKDVLTVALTVVQMEYWMVAEMAAWKAEMWVD